MSTLVPIVVEPEKGYERSYDIYSRLLKDRIVFLTGPIDMDSANTIIAQLLFLENTDKESDIKFYINSPGGLVTATMAIYDTMQLIKPDVSTLVVGMAASGASVLLAGGAKGKRYALPNSEVLIHQPHGAVEGQTTDIEIGAKQYQIAKDKIADILSKHTGKPKAEVLKDIERDFYMHGDEAQKYGIVDKVLK